MYRYINKSNKTKKSKELLWKKYRKFLRGFAVVSVIYCVTVLTAYMHFYYKIELILANALVAIVLGLCINFLLSRWRYDGKVDSSNLTFVELE